MVFYHILGDVMITSAIIDIITEEPFGPNAVTIVGSFSEGNLSPQVCVMQIGTRVVISVASHSEYWTLKTLDRAVEALTSLAKVSTVNGLCTSRSGKLHTARKKFKIIKVL
jgi:hypothetical protein